MERNIYIDIQAWNNDPNKKPLILTGQRQVGKTFIVKKFANENYKKYVYINFFEDKNISSIFEGSLKPGDVYRKLGLLLDVEITQNTLIIFDEFQEEIKTFNFFKSLNESEWANNLIATGSWIHPVLYKNRISFPVGQVNILHMHTMTIDEFILNVTSKQMIDEICDSFNKRVPLDNSIHNKLMDLYKDYLCIGGLPEIVNEYINIIKGNKKRIYESSIAKTDSITKEKYMKVLMQKRLGELNVAYLADLAKYGNPINMVKMMSLYDSIPNNLNRPYNKFKYSLIKEGSQKRDWDRYIDLITLSRLSIVTYLVEKPQIPLNGNYNSDHFKIYYSDMGLLSNRNKITLTDINKGAFSYLGWITENYAAIHLNAYFDKLFYWYKNPNEIDFLITGEDGIIPIDIKSGRKKRSKSLKQYQDNYNPSSSIVVSADNFSFNSLYMNIPLYAIYLIRDIISE